MKVETVSINKIKPYENNPRNNDDAVDAVANSIKEFGWQQPIVVDNDRVIIAGHTRYKAAKQLKLKEVPIVVADKLTKEQVNAYRLADNKSGELAEWDDAELQEELDKIMDIDMSDFGFDLDTALENDEVIDDDYEEEAPEIPKSKPGQIYQLGRHRLMCGDSTKPEDVEKLMGGVKADLLLTDPPYNVSYVGMEVRQQLIWRKNNLVMGRQDYQWQHEPCLYGWTNGGSHSWYSDRKQTTILNFDKPQRSDLHPTMKPIPLFDYQIKNSSKSGDIVLDLFGGSGTTLMACEQNGRNAYLMEFDSRYVDVIIDRWEKFTGNTAKLIQE